MAVTLDFSAGGFAVNMQNPGGLYGTNVLGHFGDSSFLGYDGDGGSTGPLILFNDELGSAEIRMYGSISYDDVGPLPDSLVTGIEIYSPGDLATDYFNPTTWRGLLFFDSPAFLADVADAIFSDGHDLRPLYTGEALGVLGGALNDTLVGGALGDTLVGLGSGDKLLGNGGLDVLDGGAGNDNINGGAGNDIVTGGLGKDTLTGGLGKDSFGFDAKGTTNVDVIKDFVHGSDKIALDNEFFTKLTEGSTLGTKFFKGTNVDAAGATTAGQRMLYDTDSGKLYYDPDGTGIAAKQLVAIVYDTGTHAAPLTASDFIVL